MKRAYVIAVGLIVFLVLGGIASAQYEKLEKILPEQDARAEGEKVRIQKETELVQELIANHKDFAVCKIRELEFHNVLAGHCNLPRPYCDNTSPGTAFAALMLLYTVGDIGGEKHRITTQLSTGVTYWTPTDKGLMAVGNEIRHETFARGTNGDVEYKWTLSLGCRELEQIDATTQLSDGLKVDFSWHWKPTDLGIADGLSGERHQGMAYLTRTANGLDIDKMELK